MFSTWWNKEDKRLRYGRERCQALLTVWVYTVSPSLGSATPLQLGKAAIRGEAALNCGVLRSLSLDCLATKTSGPHRNIERCWRKKLKGCSWLAQFNYFKSEQKTCLLRIGDKIIRLIDIGMRKDLSVCLMSSFYRKISSAVFRKA